MNTSMRERWSTSEARADSTTGFQGGNLLGNAGQRFARIARCPSARASTSNRRILFGQMRALVTVASQSDNRIGPLTSPVLPMGLLSREDMPQLQPEDHCRAGSPLRNGAATSGPPVVM